MSAFQGVSMRLAHVDVLPLFISIRMTTTNGMHANVWAFCYGQIHYICAHIFTLHRTVAYELTMSLYRFEGRFYSFRVLVWVHFFIALFLLDNPGAFFSVLSCAALIHYIMHTDRVHGNPFHNIYYASSTFIYGFRCRKLQHWFVVVIYNCIIYSDFVAKSQFSKISLSLGPVLNARTSKCRLS